MTTSILLFTRDLRVHDHPALVAAAAADLTVPLFVLDDAILAAAPAPNRLQFLLDSLTDLDASLRRIAGGDGGLVVRRGDPAAVVRMLAREVGAAQIHLTADVTPFAARRLDRLRAAAAEAGAEVITHPGHLVVAPGEVTPASSDHFRVFTPYWRRWEAAPHRRPVAVPDQLRLPPGLDRGEVPALSEVSYGATSPQVIRGGEAAGRARLDAWLEADGAGTIEAYDDERDRMDHEGTSRLSADLHLGTVSAAELVDRLDLRRRGHEPFLRQLCWREFNHQLLAANPRITSEDLRSQGDRWRDDDEALQAWRDGMTGIPIVDAGMRQLLAEGWMHNRARLLTASFLTKHLHIDWRAGAAHFDRWLVDGDVANNISQWQWVAGTGTDSRPNRMFNPVTQSRRYDPDGDYIRRHVPELAGLDGDAVHAPWSSGGTADVASDGDGAAAGYPAPIVDHAEARERFLAARGVDGRA